jgi:signal transduction histidine kinase
LAALNTRLIETQETERTRIALDLHDDPLQRAVLLARELGQNGDAFGDVARWNGQLREVISSLRAICAGLDPAPLRDLGLHAGLDWLLAEFRAKSDAEAVLRFEPADRALAKRLDPKLELALYRVTQEALNNCAKHAADATFVSVTLSQENHHVTLEVEDDGAGYNPSKTRAWTPSQLGILGMRERLVPWSGTVEIGAREGGGTRVRAYVPRNGASGGV